MPGDEPLQLYVIAGVSVGVSICEDAWSPTGPIAAHAAGGAELVLNINASPFYAGRVSERERMLATRAADASCALVYVNQVGGQDELVFDGASLVFDADGSLVARAPQFVEQVSLVDLDVEPVYRKRQLDPRGWLRGEALRKVVISHHSETDEPRPPVIAPMPGRDEEIYEALVLGTRDYVRKNGFTDVVIGLSGGIDSSLVACIAVDALGRRARARRLDAESILERRVPHRRSGRSRTTSASTAARSPSSPHTPPCSRCSLRRSVTALPTSPRRTCRAASAASSSWRSRTSSAGSC